MKKSLIYQLAQMAVLEYEIDALDKLEILRVLMDEEGIAKMMEKAEAEKRQAEEMAGAYNGVF